MVGKTQAPGWCGPVRLLPRDGGCILSQMYHRNPLLIRELKTLEGVSKHDKVESFALYVYDPRSHDK